MQDRGSVIGGVRMQTRQSMDEQPIHMNANGIKYNVIYYSGYRMVSRVRRTMDQSSVSRYPIITA